MSDWRILLGLFLISQTQLAQAQFDVVDFREVQDKPKPAPIVKTSEISIEPRVIDPIGGTGGGGGFGGATGGQGGMGFGGGFFAVPQTK